MNFLRLTSSRFLVFMKFSIFVLSFLYFRLIKSKFKLTFLNIILFLTFTFNILLFVDFYYWNMLIEIFILYFLYTISIDVNKKYIFIKKSTSNVLLICFIFLINIFILNEYRFWELLNVPHLTPSFF